MEQELENLKQSLKILKKCRSQLKSKAFETFEQSIESPLEEIIDEISVQKECLEDELREARIAQLEEY